MSIQAAQNQFISELEYYLIEIDGMDVSDTLYAKHLESHRYRTANLLEQINQIESMPMLQMLTARNKQIFYQSIRDQDKVLARVEGEACCLVRTATGLDALNVGSFGLQLNIASSDIDLGIGVPDVSKFAQVGEQLLATGFNYKQIRPTRYLSAEHTTSRFVFAQNLYGIEIDVSVYHVSDLMLLMNGGMRCRTLMSTADKACHTLNKFKLREANRLELYNIYKLEPYIRYKPGFAWGPIAVSKE